MTETLYGVVKKHPDGPHHLVLGREMQTICGARASKGKWEWVMRGIVGVEFFKTMERVCHNCVWEAERVEVR